MNIYHFVWKELKERKSQFLTSLIAVIIGIMIIVAIKSVTNSSEVVIDKQLDELGANILILPQNTLVDSYYSSDINAVDMPQEYVDRILNSNIPGINNLSPKLSQKINISGSSIILSGILPKKEFASKPIWQISISDDPVLKSACDPNNILTCKPAQPKNVIEELNEDDCIIGYEIASTYKLEEGKKYTLLGKSFNIKKVIPQTGTMDDNRIFINLNVAQTILKKGKVVNSIEIVGCCSRISEGLLGKLRNILPDTKIVSINQIVKTQKETNDAMKNFSLIFLIIIIIVGGVSIGNYMWGNVQERKREIGILLAIGYKPLIIYKIFLLKALVLGLIGGIIGYFLGMLSGLILGPIFANVTVLFDLLLFVWTLIISIVVSLLSSYFPARKAANIDVAVVLQEV